MAINRVDVTGTFIRQDVAQLRQEEDNRAYADMTRLSAQFEQRAEENHISVTGTETMEAQEQKYDASEEGKNKHLYEGRRKKQGARKGTDAAEDPDGVVIGPDGRRILGGGVPSFDLKV